MKEWIKQLLKDNKLKVTEQRMRILSVLKRHNFPLGSEDIFFSLKESGADINLSTVYRTLERLVGLNVMEKSAISGEKSAVY